MNSHSNIQSNGKGEKFINKVLQVFNINFCASYILIILKSFSIYVCTFEILKSEYYLDLLFRLLQNAVIEHFKWS